MSLHTLTVSKFRVKIKSLAAEATIIRQEEGRTLSSGRDGRFHDQAMLRSHRVTVVRNEARATQLAYAYFRGKPYAALEANSEKEFPYASVIRNLRTLAYCHVLAEQLTDWVKATPALAENAA